MIEFNTWDKTNNIVYIIDLIIGLLYNLYEGHGVNIQSTSNTEYRPITFEDESLVLRFRDVDTYSSRISIFDVGLKEFKSMNQKKNHDTNVYHSLFNRFVKGQSNI